MGLFSAVGKIVASPIIVADTIVKDIKGTKGEAAQACAIGTCGLTSVVRGIAKSVEKAADEL